MYESMLGTGHLGSITWRWPLVRSDVCFGFAAGGPLAEGQASGSDGGAVGMLQEACVLASSVRPCLRASHLGHDWYEDSLVTFVVYAIPQRHVDRVILPDLYAYVLCVASALAGRSKVVREGCAWG